MEHHFLDILERVEVETMRASTRDKEVSKNLCATIGEVVLYIHRAFGIEYCERAVCAILQKLDFVCKQTNNVPCKADPVEQEAFLGEMVPFLAEIEPDEAAYFLDGVHPQHNTRATYAWIKRGEPKNIPANSGRQRVNISGAMNAHRPEEMIIHESDLFAQPEPHRTVVEVHAQKGDKPEVLPKI